MPPHLSRIAPVRFAPARIARRLLLCVLAPIVASTAACDKVKDRLRAAAQPAGDPTWQRDSATVAQHPNVLFRVIRSRDTTYISPVATLGVSGIRGLNMFDRGWRYFDLAYLQAGMKVTPYRDGSGLTTLALARGMWEGSALDTLGCDILVPKALAAIPAGSELATSEHVSTAGRGTITDGELQAALAGIPNLIAPAAGVAPSIMPRFRRDVHVVATKPGGPSTIIAIYNDPEQLPDSVEPMTQRPRHLIVVLDKSIYGYKPSYVYKTVANVRDLPRRRFLGAIDTDGDGVSELLFGVQHPAAFYSLTTYALRFEVDQWRQSFVFEKAPCQQRRIE